MQDSIVPLTKDEICIFATLVAGKNPEAVEIERSMGMSLREVLAETDPEICAKTLNAHISAIREVIRENS